MRAYELHESRGKTRNARRPIQLVPTTVAILAAWRGWQEAERAAVGTEDSGWVFADPDGQPIHPHTISQAFERIVARALVPAIRLHDVRHIMAMLLRDAGVDISVIALWLGHESIESTQIYLYADLALEERALARTAPATRRVGVVRFGHVTSVSDGALPVCLPAAGTATVVDDLHCDSRSSSNRKRRLSKTRHLRPPKPGRRTR